MSLRLKLALFPHVQQGNVGEPFRFGSEFIERPLYSLKSFGSSSLNHATSPFLYFSYSSGSYIGSFFLRRFQYLN